MSRPGQLSVSALFFLVLTVACSESPAPVQPEGHVEMTLESEVIPTPMGDYVQALVTVVNMSSRTVHYPMGCGFDVSMAVQTSDGEAVLTRDPTLRLVCPPTFLELEPGGELVDRLGLRWGWKEDGTRYQLSSGEYLVTAGFAYYEAGDEPPNRVSKQISVTLE